MKSNPHHRVAGAPLALLALTGAGQAVAQSVQAAASAASGAASGSGGIENIPPRVPWGVGLAFVIAIIVVILGLRALGRANASKRAMGGPSAR